MVFVYKCRSLTPGWGETPVKFLYLSITAIFPGETCYGLRHTKYKAIAVLSSFAQSRASVSYIDRNKQTNPETIQTMNTIVADMEFLLGSSFTSER